MTLIEAAAILGVTPDTLRQQIARGRLKARKVGRDWHVTAAEVKRYQEHVRRGVRDTAAADSIGEALG